VVLPEKPTQISVDPDQIIVDPNPANNHWKQRIRWRFAPINTPLEETDVTNDYDRLNVIFGPGFTGSAYADPWYAKSPVIGLRGDLYRTQEYTLGAYSGYRTDFGDLVVGGEGLIDHWPWPHTQVGFNVERSLTPIEGANTSQPPSDRAVLFGRYVFNYNSSLYLPPIQYLEVFTGIRDNTLPLTHEPIPDTDHFDHQTVAGIHYHLDLQTPYWDPESGFRFDATFATGIPILGEQRAFNTFETQFAQVLKPPDCLGPLAETKIAYRLYFAGGLPDDGEYFTLGGSQLFRGYDLRQRQGNLIWLGSLEWRVPFARGVEWDYCDHVVGVRNAYIAAFYDVGNAYVNGHQTGPVAHDLGVGLRLDIAWLSFIERCTLRFDVAKTIDSPTPWQFWFGVQAPF
jgi:outer membrane protein assembly factor BamA